MIQLTEQDLAKLRTLITEFSGLSASVQTQSALEQAVAQRLAAHQVDSLADYWPLLRARSARSGEMRRLVRMLTNKETFFFREAHHFDVLRNRVLPEWVALNRLAPGTAADRPLRIWSAGCATGEEPYTLAITLLEFQARHGKFKSEIVATDIDTLALEQARQGCYLERAVRHVPEDLLARYFIRDGRTYRMSPDVTELVTFRVHNLAEDCCPPGLANVDIVFCRNVTIYFDEGARDHLNARLADSLREGGYLFVASAETMGHNRGRLELVSMGETFLFHKAVPSTRVAQAADASVSGLHQADLADEPPQPPILTRLTPGGAGVQSQAPVALPGVVPQAPPERPRPTVAREPSTPPVAPSEPVAVLQRAWRAFQQHDFELALRELDRLSGDIVWIEAYCLRGAILLQQERLDEAEAACQTVLAHDPWHADAHFLLGLVFRQQGQAARAIRSLKQAIYLESTHRHAHYYLAETYRALGLASQAQREYENTLNILAQLPEPSPALNLIGLQDEMLRRASEVNLRKLREPSRAPSRGRTPSKGRILRGVAKHEV